MITDKNKSFLARFGSADTTKKIWDENNSVSDGYYRHSLYRTPFVHESIADIFTGKLHPNISDEKMKREVDSATGYGRMEIFDHPKMNIDHIHQLDQKRQINQNEFNSLVSNKHLKEPELNFLLGQDVRMNKMDIYASARLALNKNLNNDHIKRLIVYSKHNKGHDRMLENLSGKIM